MPTADLNTLANLLTSLNSNLSVLVDTVRWSGKYSSIEDQYQANTERQDYDFKWPVRFLRVYANQPIKIQLNDVGNPVISVDVSEMPFILSGIMPGFNVDRIYITPGRLATNIKILAMG
jgi:hypothetical protein